MKKTLIATAVSAALMAPVAAQADVTVYGRIHQGIQITSPEVGDSTTDFVGIVSRFGIKASSDLGNGVTASAQYEFGTTSDRNNHGKKAVEKATDGSLWYKDSSGITNRIATVGVSSGFGSVTLGNQWSAYYDIAGVHMDPTFWLGYVIYSSLVGAPYRTANTIKYSNSFGPVSLELDQRIDDSDNPSAGDGTALGFSIAAGNLTFAAGIDSDDARDLSGLGVNVAFGNYWASIASQKKNTADSDVDPSSTHLWAGGSFGDTSAMIGRGSADLGGSGTGNNPSDLTLGVYHNLGGGLKLLYEGNKKDSDGAGKDTTNHVFGMRLDF